MKIGLEVEYALIAVAYIAQHSKDGLVTALKISETYVTSDNHSHLLMVSVLRIISRAKHLLPV